MRRILVTGLLAALAGCAPAPHLMNTPFSDAAFAPWAGSGPSSLTGQAFLKTVGGDVKTCAGERVTLIPANTYDNEWVGAASAGHSTHLPPYVGRYFRTTRCDADGRFGFTGLPARRWFVLTVVTWGVPNGNEFFNTTDTQGGELLRAIDLRPGANQVLLTSADEEAE